LIVGGGHLSMGAETDDAKGKVLEDFNHDAIKLALERWPLGNRGALSCRWMEFPGFPADTATRRPPPPVDPGMEGRLPAELPYLRAFLQRLVVGYPALEVDDLQQQTMDRALQYQHRYDRERPLRPWLQAIAFRLFLDARQAALGAPQPLAREPEVAGATVGLTAEDVERLLALLPVQQADILRRFYLQGQSVADIAGALKMAAGTVKSHLHRARLRLAQEHRAEAWQ